MDELTKAGIKFEMRQQYKEIGCLTALQIVIELISSATLWLEVINEEVKKKS